MRGLAPLVCAALVCAGCMDGADKTSTEPPGSRIAFVAGGDGFIFTVRRDGRGLRRLTRGTAWGAQRLE